MEEAHYLLSSVYAKPTHSEAAVSIDEFEKLIETIENPVDNQVLKQTRKICQKFGYYIFGRIPKLYIHYLKIIDKTKSDLLITLCNDSLQVKESLTGTNTAEQINNAIREALVFSIQKGFLDSEQSKVVQELLEAKQNVNFDEELSIAIEEIDNNSNIGVHMMIDLFSSLPSIKDQFYYFSTKISPFVKSLQPKKTVEIYSLVIRFMDIFLVPTKFPVKINESIVVYKLSYIDMFNEYEDVFYTSIGLLKILLKSDRFINETSVKIIIKLWNLYPNLRSHLYDLIVGNFKTINTSNSLEPKRKAAEFLYTIMHDKDVEGDFKGRLENEGLDSLFDDESYDTCDLPAVDVKNLKINAGYPVCCNVNAGEKSAHYVEIEVENSILFWGFACEEYDFSYTISRMDTVEELLFREDHVSSDSPPVVGSLLIMNPGLYKFEWNNSFSWFRGKTIRYRICVLVPSTQKNIEEEPKAVKVLNPDETGDLCYILPNSQYSEIGIFISSDSLSFFSKALETTPLSQIQDLNSAILTYCQANDDKVKKIGIIEKNPQIRKEILDTGCVAICRDIDAFALMNHDALQVHTLIAVLDNDGIRSAVVIEGKLFSSGNVANLKNQEPAAAIAALLSLFGPGTVVVSGVDIEKLVARVRLLVPINIWNHSQIVFSDFSLAECAARLHYLLYRYKSSL